MGKCGHSFGVWGGGDGFQECIRGSCVLWDDNSHCCTHVAQTQLLREIARMLRQIVPPAPDAATPDQRQRENQPPVPWSRPNPNPPGSGFAKWADRHDKGGSGE